MRKHLFLFVMLAFALVGCKREVSTLDFSSLKDSAVITGKVTYSVGQAFDSTTLYVADVVLPAAGKKVFVEVPMSEYKADANGTKVFTAVVDAEGNFSLSIPVKATGINGATLRYEEFTAEYSKYLKMEAGVPVFETRMYRYETPAEIYSLPTLKPGTNAIGNEASLRYVGTPIDMKDYAETAIIDGTIKLPYETAYRTGAYKVGANCKIEISIKDGEDYEEKKDAATTFTYGVVTDENGAFSLALPIKDMRKGFKMIKFQIVPAAEKGFTHYVNAEGKQVTLHGVYESREAWAKVGADIWDVAEVIDGVNCSLGSIAMQFVPYYNNEITTKPQAENWDNNLAGWVFGTREFANMKYTATISGTINMPEETAFATGRYVKNTQTIKLSASASPYSTYTVLTDAEGNYSLTIPVASEGTPAGGKWSVSSIVNPTSIAFTHYLDAAGKTKVYKEGSYSIYNTIKADDAEWYEIGDTYAKFVPANITEEEKWTDNLLGWFRNANYKESVTFTTEMYFAKETAFAVGEYQGDANMRAYVEWDGQKCVVPCAANGKMSFTLPVKDADAAYSAEMSLVGGDVNNFVFYTKKGSTKIAGQYTNKYEFKDAEADWNKTQCVYYYAFNPTTAVEGWQPNLAGWFKKQKYTLSANVSGKAYMPYEKSYGVGAYKAADKELVQIYVSDLGTNLVAPVINGSFSVAVPLRNAGDEYTVSVSPVVGGEMSEFEHYKDNTGKKQVLEGTYAYRDKVRANDAAWNDMGSVYYQFNPQIEPAVWTPYLQGWVAPIYQADFKPEYTKEESGSMMLAAETGFWKGTYVAYANQLVTTSYSAYGKTYFQIVVTDADGNWTCPMYKKFADDDFTMSSSLCMTATDEFEHYYHASSPTTMKVSGTYSVYKKIGTKQYYKFSPNGKLEDWSNRLVGWYLVDDKKANVTFTLSAKRAFETTASGNHEAAWTNATKAKATVTIQGDAGNTIFDVYTTAGSLSFSIPVEQTMDDTKTTKVSVFLWTENNATFKHYPAQDENNSIDVKGYYYSADNIDKVVLTYDNGFKAESSAKMLFKPESTPEGWYSYDWNAIMDAD